MKLKGVRQIALLVSVMVTAVVALGETQGNNGKAGGPAVDSISAEELKAKIDRNEPVAIIDVRSSSVYAESDNKIKGAIHVKLRRLKSRLLFAPLKHIPKDREMITYCACPSDEASLRAAQILKEAGFKRVRILKGGWQAWLNVRGSVEPRPRGL